MLFPVLLPLPESPANSVRRQVDKSRDSRLFQNRAQANSDSISHYSQTTCGFSILKLLEIPPTTRFCAQGTPHQLLDCSVVVSGISSTFTACIRLTQLREIPVMRVSPRSIGRPVVILACLALLILAAYGLAQQRRRFRQAPRFEGATIPDPPRQREPWQPPATALPRFLVGASATLFEQGLADPRGCDYHAIEIGIGNVWSGDGGVLKTHGWVLPAPAGEKTRFAVAWSGLVYPVVSIGEPADPAEDVKIIAQEARAAREARAKHPNMGGAGFNGFGTNNEASSVSPTSLHAIKVCLLLRLGRPELAEAVWAAGTDRTRDAGPAAAKANSDLTSDGISYVSLANDFAWYLFDRAVCADMRGDDALALADARQLTSLQKAVETQAEAMGYDRPRRLVDRGEGPAPYIEFLGQLPELLADHERRAREPKRPPVPPPGADKQARIAALIADLDQVAARQFSQPGGVSLGASPIVKALVELGDDAVGPLIEDLKHDPRLTRSVHIWRDFHRSRFIMGAHEAAYTALVGILETSFFGAASTGDNLSARGLQGSESGRRSHPRLLGKE